MASKSSKICLALVACATVFISQASVAQLDPSSALLLSGSSDISAREPGIDSGRYQVRRRKLEPANPPVQTARKIQVPESPASDTQASPSEPVPPPAPITIVVPSSTPVVVPAVPTPAPERRAHVLEISISPGFVYTNSDSNYFYRRYSTAAPTLAADAQVWLTPAVGLHTGYMTTLGASVSDSTDRLRDVAAAQEWMTAGLRTKKYFGSGALAPSMVFGIDYLKYQFKVPTDAALRDKLTSSGVQLSLEAEVPSSDTYAWTLGFSFAPKLRHSEDRTTAEFESGGNVDANAVGASFGGKLRFEQSDEMFWRVGYVVERDLFSGQATRAEPGSLIAPSGVGVTDSFALVQFGYSWGN